MLLKYKMAYKRFFSYWFIDKLIFTQYTSLSFMDSVFLLLADRSQDPMCHTAFHSWPFYSTVSIIATGTGIWSLGMGKNVKNQKLEWAGIWEFRSGI